jgi:protoporphyrinogen oxidase
MGIDLIVIGGGVSGLVLAHRAAAAGRSVLLLEKSPQLGGCLDSRELAPGFWLEMGAHTAYNSYGALLDILAARGGLQRLTPRAKLGYRFLDGGRLQNPLSRLDLWLLARSLPAAFSRSKDGTTLAGYYGAIAGQRNYERVLAPAFAAVLSQPADDFPAAWLFRRKPRRSDAPRSYTWPGGLQGIAETMAQGAPFDLRRDAEAIAVERSPEGYRVLLADGGRFECAALALATPHDVAAALLRDAAPEIARRLAAIPVAGCESVGVALPATACRLPPVAGLIGAGADFYSAVSRDTVPHPELRGFTFHFRPQRRDRSGKLELIARVLGCHPGDFVAVQEKANRLPAVGLSHLDSIGEIDRLLAGSRLALAGNTWNGLSIGDCADRAAREAQRLLALDR